MAERCKRCSTQHRIIKKELAKWHKNVALLCGMERVAQELMGGRKWRKLMTPFNSLEQNSEPEDWSPRETCYFCNSKTQYSYDSTDSVVPPCDELLDDKSNNNDDGDQCSLCAGRSTPNSKCSCKSSHSPQSNDQPLDLSTHSRHKGSPKHQKHSEAVPQTANNNNNKFIKVPQPLTTTKAIKRNNLSTNSTWKRTYTEEELQAALRDIQSGKLGTRRAAVIYGIPRSTLRNKVYKLALERSNGKHKTLTSTATTKNTTTSALINKKLSKSSLLNHNHKNTNSTLSHVSDISNNGSTSASESLKQILKNAITQRATGNSNTTSSSGVSPAKAKSNESIESTLSTALAGQALLGLPGVGFNTDLYNCEALATIQMLSTIDCGQALAPLFTQFLLNVYSNQLALAKRQSDENSDDMTNSMSTQNIPILPDLIRKLAEDQIVQTARTNSSQPSNQSNGDSSESQQELSGNNNVILKVPSYKPKTSSAAVNTSELKQSIEEQPNVSPSDTETVNQLCTSSSHTESDERITDEFESKSISLKDIIAKSISQRLYNSTTSAKFSNVANSEDSSSDALQSDDKYDSTTSDLKNSGNVSDHSNPSTPEKRNRPKRGRYRNYNRDDLAKAVKAVQRGEMSVHRAGTLFGVPHSTLEYKVKERHLLRPKKRLNETSVAVKKESTNKANGSTTDRLLNGTSPLLNSDTTISSANNSLPFWQSLPFLQGEVSNSSANFFASNMMRKLQENARMNEELIKTQNEPNSEYGGLLLESLIKSSLMKKSKEESIKEESEDENNDKKVVNTSLELLKEVSALGKQD